MSNVISFNVYKNTLRRSSGNDPVSSESGYTEILCRFKEGDDWDEFEGGEISAGFFVNEEDVHPVTANVLNGEARFKIPAGLIGNRNPIYFGVVGSYQDGDNVITIATNVVKLDVIRGVLITSASGDPEEDVNIYSQLLTTLNEGLTSKAAIDHTHPEYMSKGELHVVIDNIEDVLDSVAIPQQYGAMGDGVTDDTAAIQAAINDKDLIYFPQGTYIIDTSSHSAGTYGLVIPSNKTLIFDDNAVLQQKWAGRDSLFNEQGVIDRANILHLPNGTENVTIKGGRFIGDRPNKLELLTKKVNDEYVISFADLLRWYKGSSGHNNGIRLDNCKNIKIDGVHVEDMAGDGISIAASGEELVYCENISIVNSTIDKSWRNNINIGNCRGIVVENCQITNAGCNLDLNGQTVVRDELISSGIPSTIEDTDTITEDWKFPAVYGQIVEVKNGGASYNPKRYAFEAASGAGTYYSDVAGIIDRNLFENYTVVFRRESDGKKEGRAKFPTGVLNGWMPMCGIDIETDNPIPMPTKQVHIRNCVFSGNAQNDIDICNGCDEVYVDSCHCETNIQSERKEISHKDENDNIVVDLAYKPTDKIIISNSVSKGISLHGEQAVGCEFEGASSYKDGSVFTNCKIGKLTMSYSDSNATHYFFGCVIHGVHMPYANDTKCVFQNCSFSIYYKGVSYFGGINILDSCSILIEYDTTIGTSIFNGIEDFMAVNSSFSIIANVGNSLALLKTEPNVQHNLKLLNCYFDIPSHLKLFQLGGTNTVTVCGCFFTYKNSLDISTANGTVTKHGNIYKDIFATSPLAAYGITDAYTKTEVNNLLSGKYEKPSGGIPKTDLSSEVQTSLGKADSALQSHQSLANYYNKIEVNNLLSGKADTSHTHSQYLTLATLPIYNGGVQ